MQEKLDVKKPRIPRNITVVKPSIVDSKKNNGALSDSGRSNQMCHSIV